MDSNPFDRSLAFVVRWLSDITFCAGNKKPQLRGLRCALLVIQAFCTGLARTIARRDESQRHGYCSWLLQGSGPRGAFPSFLRRFSDFLSFHLAPLFVSISQIYACQDCASTLIFRQKKGPGRFTGPKVFIATEGDAAMGRLLHSFVLRRHSNSQF